MNEAVDQNSEHLKLFGAVRKEIIGSVQHVSDRPIRALALRVARGVAGTKSKVTPSLKTLFCNCFLFVDEQYDIVLM